MKNIKTESVFVRWLKGLPKGSTINIYLGPSSFVATRLLSPVFTKKAVRSAKTGKFVSEKFGKKHPKTTVKEKIK